MSALSPESPRHIGREALCAGNEQDDLADVELAELDAADQAEALWWRPVQQVWYAQSLPPLSERVRQQVLTHRTSRLVRARSAIQHRSRRSRSRRRWSWFIPVAAMILLVPALLRLQAPAPAPASASAPQPETAAAQPAAAVAASPITVPPGGGVLPLADGSSVALSRDGQALVQPSDAGTAIMLGNGSLTCAVAPQTAGKTFSVVTAAGSVTVIGTRFRVDHRRDLTSVQVDAGTVRFRGTDAVDVHPLTAGSGIDAWNNGRSVLPWSQRHWSSATDPDLISVGRPVDGGDSDTFIGDPHPYAPQGNAVVIGSHQRDRVVCAYDPRLALRFAWRLSGNDPETMHLQFWDDASGQNHHHPIDGGQPGQWTWSVVRLRDCTPIEDPDRLPTVGSPIRYLDLIGGTTGHTRLEVAALHLVLEHP